MSQEREKESGISPVVGAILMVAITVVLAAVILFFVTGLANDPTVGQAGVSVNENPDGTVTIQLVDAGNADEIIVRTPSGDETLLVGDEETVSEDVQVIAVVGESETLLRNVESEATSPSIAHNTAPTISDCSTVYPSGDGSPSNPYTIVDDWGLQCIEQDLSAHYIIMNDIDASQTGSWNGGLGFAANGDIYGGATDYFTGSLDGQGYTIDGLTHNRQWWVYVGLFEGTDGATVENIRFTNVTSESYGSSGTVVGVAEDSTIEDIVIEDSDYTITSGSARYGGVVGHSIDSDIRNIDVTNTYIESTGGTFAVGGVVGYATSTTLEQVNYDGAIDHTAVDSDGYAGGIIGSTYGSGNTLNDISANVNITAIDQPVLGGIVGQTYGGDLYISNTVVSGTMDVRSGGGVIGDTENNHTEITNTTVTTDVSVDFTSTNTPLRVGGVVGTTGMSSHLVLDNVNYDGQVIGRTEAGGLIGVVRGASTFDIQDSTTRGYVYSYGETGGMIGYIDSTASGSTIERTVSHMEVESIGFYAGGAIGHIDGSGHEFRNIYSTGDVTGADNVGGLVGALSSNTITNSYATGQVTATASTGYEGGLAGSSFGGTITDSYWDTQSTGQTDASGAPFSGSATGLTTSQMTGSNAQSNMTGFDFTTIWQTVTGDYPTLQ